MRRRSERNRSGSSVPSPACRGPGTGEVGHCIEIAPQSPPSPTLPRKRGRERTAFAALFNERLTRARRPGMHGAPTWRADEPDVIGMNPN